MGTWGVDSFENDGACDFTYEVEKSSDLKSIESALDAVLAAGQEYLEAPAAEEAIAAADIVARLRGQFGQRDSYTEKIDEWVRKVKLTVPDAMVEKARRAVNRVMSSPSEMAELWEESEEAEAWKASTGALLQRLQ